MGGNFYDGDDVNVKGDDGSEDGVKITSTTVSTKKCLDTNVAQSALPTGAATAANQATEIASLASIDAGIPAALGQTTMANSMPVTIASNQTALPITISGNATEAEYATFTVVTLDVASANNKSLISILNAGGSSVKVKIREIKLVNTQNTAVTGVLCDINLYRMTGHSAGTSLTPLAMDTADSLNGSVTARTNGTITGEGTSPLLHIDLSTDEWGVGANDVESFDHTMQSLNSFYRTAPKTKPLTLNAGEGITLKCVTNTTTGLFDIIIVFTQE